MTKEDDRHMEIFPKLCSLVMDNTLLYEEKKAFSITDFQVDKIPNDALINYADKFMHQAKHEERNRVIGGPFAPQV